MDKQLVKIEKTKEDKQKDSENNGLVKMKIKYNMMWMNSFIKLQDFINKNEGRYPNLKSENEEEKKLGIWVNNQKLAYRAENLSQERIKKLNELGFVWDVHVVEWDRKYQELKEFLSLNQGKHPNKKSKDEKEKILGNWVMTQRHLFKLGKMSQERIDKLNEIGFIWNQLESWDNIYNLLVEFISKNGRYPSKESKDEEERRLGIWVSHQKQVHKVGRLNQDRIDKFIELGLLLNLDDEWITQFNEMNMFLSLNQGKYPNNNSKNEEEKRLASWVGKQRKAYKSGKLSKNKEDRLKEIGFVWDFWEFEWCQKSEDVETFVLVNGKYPKTYARDEEERRLGAWVSNQRIALKNGKMSLQRYHKLRRQKFVFDTKEEETLAKASKQFFKEADQEWSR